MIEINLKKIYSGSIYLKTIVILVTIFLIFTSGYFFCLRSKLDIREKGHLSLLALKKELNEQLKISEISYYQEKIKNLKSKFDIYDNEQIDELVSHILIGQLITPIGIENKIFSPIKSENSIISLQIKNNLLSLSNFINFLNVISKLDKFILVESFRWNISNALPNSKKKNLFFLFKIYSSSSNKKNLILALSKKIKLNAKSTLDKAVLIKYPLNKIKMIGYFSYNRIKNLGFVLLPNKKIFKIQLGDQLGIEQGLVIGVYNRKILILNKNFDKIIKFSIKNKKLYYVENFS